MKAAPCKPGDRIETLPHVGVARGELLARVTIKREGFSPIHRWRARLELPGGTDAVLLERRDFVVLQEAPALDLEEAAAERRAKRRGGSK